MGPLEDRSDKPVFGIRRPKEYGYKVIEPLPEEDYVWFSDETCIASVSGEICQAKGDRNALLRYFA
jgi:hypothetical protein